MSVPGRNLISLTCSWCCFFFAAAFAFFSSYNRLPKSMIFATGGSEDSAINTRSRSFSRAATSASFVLTTPICSPVGPIKRTCGARISSLISVRFSPGAPLGCALLITLSPTQYRNGHATQYRCEACQQRRLRSLHLSLHRNGSAQPPAGFPLLYHRSRVNTGPVVKCGGGFYSRSSHCANPISREDLERQAFFPLFSHIHAVNPSLSSQLLALETTTAATNPRYFRAKCQQNAPSFQELHDATSRGFVSTHLLRHIRRLDGLASKNRPASCRIAKHDLNNLSKNIRFSDHKTLLRQAALPRQHRAHPKHSIMHFPPYPRWHRHPHAC